MTDARHKEARFDPSIRHKMTPKEMAEMFDDFADDYDQEVIDKGLRAHEIVGEHLAKLYPESERSKLKKLGFSHVDGLDPAQKMLDKAKVRDVYQKYICAFIDENRVEGIETDYYDCVTATAGFNQGLIPCNGFNELIRVVKPGGKIVFTVPNKNIVNAVEYRDRLLPLISKLAEEGAWTVTSVDLPDGAIAHSLGPSTLYSLEVKVSEKYFRV